MGKYLDQCCNDAWDVIRGRKKIVGNNIIEVADESENEEKRESEYGWLAPDGIFYPVEFGNHQTWAAKYIKELYRKGNISVEELRNVGSGDHAGDWLIDCGWVLIHNPQQSITKITRNPIKRFTKRQKEFLYDYFCKRQRNKEAEEILADEI